jgi:hypothetical protein
MAVTVAVEPLVGLVDYSKRLRSSTEHTISIRVK